MGVKEIWEVEMKIQLHIISSSTIHKLDQTTDPDLLKVELSPLPSDNKSTQDTYSLKIQFAFPVIDEKSSLISIVNHGKQLLDGIISRLAFLTNAPIIRQSPPTFTHQFPNTNKFRNMSVTKELVNIQPPKMIDNFGFMTSKIDPRITRALNFSHESMTTSDLIGSFIYLWSALEILVNLFEVIDFEPKKCINCGYEFQKNPSIKDSINFVLKNQLSIDDKLINDIWYTRNDISHHGLALSVTEINGIEVLRNKLYLIVRKLISLQIGDSTILSNNDIPFAFFTGAFLDIEYTL